MSPASRRRGAAVLLIVSVLVGWPASWFLPDIGSPWFERVLLWISFLAITITCADVLATTDVRAEAVDDEGGGDDPPT
jgi:hypothetical protein